jgi:hypothetical protein
MQYLLCTLDYNYIIITQKEMHYCVFMAATLIAILISFRRYKDTKQKFTRLIRALRTEYIRRCHSSMLYAKYIAYLIRI